MEKRTRMHWVAAAVLILLVGAVVALAEERIEVRVEKDGDEEVSVDVNGVREVIHIDDLADGESRTFDVGDHELVVTRSGDELQVITEGHGLGDLGGPGKAEHVMVWVGDGGEMVILDGDDEVVEKGMMILKVEADGEGEKRIYRVNVDGDEIALDDEITIDIEEILHEHGVDGHKAIFLSADGAGEHPTVIKRHLHEGLAKYRCEETGATLLVKEEDAIEDTYICPATGCLMERVEEPEMKVITIKKRIEVEDDD